MDPTRSSVKALGEIALRVNSLDDMQHFYEHVIGLQLVKRFPKAAFLKIADGYGGPTQVLALFDRSGEILGPRVHSTAPEGVSTRASTLDHLAFEIDLADYDAEKERLQQLDLKVETAVHEWTKWRSLYVSDPEGNTVEFVCHDDSI